MDEIRLDTNLADYLILVIYFVAVLGIGFAAKRYTWALTRPLSDELEEAERAKRDRTVTGQPAPTGPDAAALAGSKTTRRRSRRDRD